MTAAKIVELQEETAQPANAQKPQLFIATPCYGCMLTIQYLQCMLQTQLSLASHGVGMILQTVGNESLITRARNLLTKQFMDSGATHLLFIDADISWDPAAIYRLLEKNEGVVSTSYPKKFYDWKRIEDRLQRGSGEPIQQAGLDFNLNVMTREVQVTNGFAEVLDAATGFMLVKREAMERMYAHYNPELLVVNDLVGARQTIKDYVALFDCMIDPDTKRSLSEDFAFSRRWQQLGERVHMDLGMPLGHTGSFHFEGDVRLRLQTPEGRDSLRKPSFTRETDIEVQTVKKQEGKTNVLLAIIPTDDERVSVGFTMSLTKLISQLQVTDAYDIQVKLFVSKNTACDYMWANHFHSLVLLDAMLSFEPASVLDMLKSKSPLEAGVYPSPEMHWEQMSTHVHEPVSSRGLTYPVTITDSPTDDNRQEAVTAGLKLAKLDRCVLEAVAERLDPNATYHKGQRRLWFHEGIYEDRRICGDEMFCRLWGRGVTLNLTSPVTLLSNLTFAGVVLARNQIR